MRGKDESSQWNNPNIPWSDSGDYVVIVEEVKSTIQAR